MAGGGGYFEEGPHPYPVEFGWRGWKHFGGSGVGMLLASSGETQEGCRTQSRVRGPAPDVTVPRRGTRLGAGTRHALADSAPALGGGGWYYPRFIGGKWRLHEAESFTLGAVTWLITEVPKDERVGTLVLNKCRRRQVDTPRICGLWETAKSGPWYGPVRGRLCCSHLPPFPREDTGDNGPWVPAVCSSGAAGFTILPQVTEAQRG